jgi:glycine oxidase
LHQQSSSSADVVVIGGGVIGLAVGWQAARKGLKVLVVERDRVGGGTSRLAAGMLAPVAEADPAEPLLLALGSMAARGYPEFIAQLRAQSPLDPGYLRCGTLLAARDSDEAEALTRALALRERLGLSVRRLRGSQARALEPALAPALRLALELPEDHAVDPRALTSALADALTREGGTVCEGAEVAKLVCGEDRVQGVMLAGGARIAAEQVVVAAGVWSGQIGGLPAAAQVPVRPVKGQILRMHDPAGPGLLNRVLRLERIYVVPRGDGRYVLGATMEERGFDVTVTAGGVLELLREATELLPGLSELVIDELSAGLRPGTPDNAPIIGPGGVAGLHWATGHYRGGVLLAPITAQLVAAMLADEEPEIDVGAFSSQRFTRKAIGAAR